MAKVHIALCPSLLGLPWQLRWWLMKESACNAGDLSLIPGSGRSVSLDNSMDRGTWWAIVHGMAKSQTQPSN